VLGRATNHLRQSFNALWRGEPTAPSGSLWRPDTLGSAMPIARRVRETALPDAWWRSRIWRTQGAAQRTSGGSHVRTDGVAMVQRGL
jgi:hypothetical protein